MAVIFSQDREYTGKSGHTTTTEAMVQDEVVQAEPKHHDQRQEDKAQPGALVTS